MQNDPNIDAVSPVALLPPSKNINIHEGGIGRRGGTEKVNGTAVSGSPRIMGLFDYHPDSATSFVVFGARDGNIYQDSTTSIKSGMSLSNFYGFEEFDGDLYITDGETIPQIWNGVAASTSDIANPAVDWSGSSYPKYMIKHSRGSSTRMVAFGAANNIKDVYLSTSGDGQDFVTDVVKFTIRESDGFGIVGAVEFGERFLLFGKKKTWILNDTDIDSANWGYAQAILNGGAAHQRVIVKTDNDIFVMAEDGLIYSITAVQSYGDYKVASITRPAYIDMWIRDNVDLASIEDFHGVFDQKLRAIKWFVVRSGKSVIDTALVYFIDRPAEIAWAVHDNQNNPSGYDASCSSVVRESAGNILVYTGDYSGFLWSLESIQRNDDSFSYVSIFRTPHLTFDNSRITKKYVRGFVITEPKGAYDLQVTIYVDGNPKTTQTVSLAGTGAALGSFILDVDVLGGQLVLNLPFDIGYVGKRIAIEIFNSNADEDFFVSQLMIDFVPLGKSAV